MKLFQLRCGNIVSLNRLECSLSREHAGLEGEMNSLQAHRIQKTGGVANDQPSIEVVLRLRPIPSLGNGLRAVEMERSALEDASNVRMRLEFLKTLMRIYKRIEIIQANDKPDGNTAVRHVVDE